MQELCLCASFQGFENARTLLPFPLSKVGECKNSAFVPLLRICECKNSILDPCGSLENARTLPSPHSGGFRMRELASVSIMVLNRAELEQRMMTMWFWNKVVMDGRREADFWSNAMVSRVNRMITNLPWCNEDLVREFYVEVKVQGTTGPNAGPEHNP
ncbi:uncharacterized protein G2W53_039302 [Senna tora]|uniref:Uncharacterized protein n=1 Tax=Senna tora TaxID=362788 RepID=A0A834W604_9FABA|nr:uncharacterized protein G2W53_039302 [Senna tora]